MARRSVVGARPRHYSGLPDCASIFSLARVLSAESWHCIHKMRRSHAQTAQSLWIDIAGNCSHFVLIVPAPEAATMSTITLHDLAVSPRPIVGVECDHCIRRAAHGGNGAREDR